MVLSSSARDQEFILNFDLPKTVSLGKVLDAVSEGKYFMQILIKLKQLLPVTADLIGIIDWLFRYQLVTLSQFYYFLILPIIKENHIAVELVTNPKLTLTPYRRKFLQDILSQRKGTFHPLFFNLCKYFDGKTSRDDILWLEGLSKDEFVVFLKDHSDYIIEFELIC